MCENKAIYWNIHFLITTSTKNESVCICFVVEITISWLKLCPIVHCKHIKNNNIAGRTSSKIISLQLCPCLT
jgi:hypothetical protein